MDTILCSHVLIRLQQHSLEIGYWVNAGLVSGAEGKEKRAPGGKDQLARIVYAPLLSSECNHKIMYLHLQVNCRHVIKISVI